MRRKMGWTSAVSVLAVAALLFGASAVRAATIQVGSVEGEPGSTVGLDVILVTSQGEEVVGTENVVSFPAEAAILATGDPPSPDCAVNPAINKTATAFSFVADNTAVKALVLSFANVSPIPSGSVLYTCQVGISAEAQPGDSFPMTCSEPGASDAEGGTLDAFCENGAVSVPIPPEVTDTPTRTETPLPPEATETPTRTATRPPSAECDDDDGCQIVGRSSSKSGWLLLVPVGVLLWVRRRSR